jgi:hypothetical protein
MFHGVIRLSLGLCFDGFSDLLGRIVPNSIRASRSRLDLYNRLREDANELDDMQKF